MRQSRAPLAVSVLLISLGLAFASLGAACADDDTRAGATGDGGTSTSSSGGTTRRDGSTTSQDSGEDEEEESEDAGKRDDASDSSTNEDDASASCPGPIVTSSGETCVGFGIAPDTCPSACGQPAGYLCINGGPPGFTGCREKQTTSLGNTYCCPENKCVPQPDQNASCATTTGKPNRYQCPPKPGGGHVDPPAGCVDMSEDGGNDLEKYFCCP